MNTARRLHEALAAAAIPIDGVSIGRDDDRLTWRIDFRPEATDEQRSVASRLLETFDPDDVAIVDAERTAQAAREAVSPSVQATIIWQLTRDLRRPPTREERQAAEADWALARKGVA